MPLRAQTTTNDPNKRWLSPHTFTLPKIQCVALSQQTHGIGCSLGEQMLGTKSLLVLFSATKCCFEVFYPSIDSLTLGSSGATAVSQHKVIWLEASTTKAQGLRCCSQQLLLIFLPLSFIPLLQCKINTFRSEIMQCLACIPAISF